jgi:hypothetical protein
MKVVKVLEPIEVASAVTGRQQQRRIAVLQRDDEHFSFAEEYFYTSEYEGKVVSKGWAQLPAEGIFATAEIAETEGRSALFQRHNHPSVSL